MRIFQIGCVALVLLVPGFKIGGVTPPPAAHQSTMKARVVSVDGTKRTATLEGAGCTESICSRVFLRGKDEQGATLQPLFGSIAAITNTTHSGALFVMRDGSELRLTFLPDFRVLYMTNRYGVQEKLDLSKITSIEFLR